MRLVRIAPLEFEVEKRFGITAEKKKKKMKKKKKKKKKEKKCRRR